MAESFLMNQRMLSFEEEEKNAFWLEPIELEKSNL